MPVRGRDLVFCSRAASATCYKSAAASFTEVADAWQEGSEAVLSAAQVSNFAIILSQSCDAENPQRPALDYVTIGAIRPIAELSLGNQDNCRHHKLVRYHYLPSNAAVQLPESIVYFGLLTLVSQSSLVGFKSSRILALESPHREDLGHRFGEFFSRVALP
jgi:hypothetical protein